MPRNGNQIKSVRLNSTLLEDRITPAVATMAGAGECLIGVRTGEDSAVSVFDSDGSVRSDVEAGSEALAVGGRVAFGDVNGDGVDDRIAGATAGGEPRVTITDGETGTEVTSFLAYEGDFTGGVYVGAADLDGDGLAEIVTGTDQGGGPRVRIFEGSGVLTGGEPGVLADFLAIDDANFRGGVRVALGDVDGDDTPDLFVGAGFGGGPRVTAFDGTALADGQVVKLIDDFFAFEASLRDGIFPAVGDMNGDGFGDLMCGAGPGGGPRVTTFDGQTALAGGDRVISDFFAGDPGSRDGARIGAVHHRPGASSADPEPRSIDGTGNNLSNPEWGSTGEQLLRVAPADYADGLSSPAGADRPGAREISNALAAQTETSTNDRELSSFLYVWGQFIDHDIDLTEAPHTGEPFDIPVPAGDPFFDPAGTGTATIPLVRSPFDPDTGTDDARQQTNGITAFIDGSMVYGSDAGTAASLRSFEGGKLLVGEDGLLPTDEDGNFLAGDVRVNENVSLTSMHTLFVREHNRIADGIAAGSPGLSDEEIYQAARSRVIAEIQAITYNEFLPALLGDSALSRYQGYDPEVNPGIANEFSTAAFRFGHSTINDDVEFFDNDGRAVGEEVALSEAFFNPDLLRETGIDPVLKYVASSRSQEFDTQIVDSLRNFLFGAPGQGGLDLASLNIQRGRDHGLADYNTVREAYGLGRVTDFADITSDPELRQKLADLYGTVDDIDLWVGVLAEDHVRGASLGELGGTIIADQFERVRDGDRYWYQNILSDQDIREVERTTLADIIERNTTVEGLQDDVFFMRGRVSGTVFADADADGIRDRSERGLVGIPVELLNDEGEVVAWAVTSADGRYRFTQFDETGEYRIRVVVPDGGIDTTPTVRDVWISSGDERIERIDFGIGGIELDTPGGPGSGRQWSVAAQR